MRERLLTRLYVLSKKEKKKKKEEEEEEEEEAKNEKLFHSFLVK